MKRLTTSEFIERAKFVHGDTYDYGRVVYHDMHSNVEIVCKKHGVFLQTPSNHLKGHGCEICNKRDGRSLGISEFLSRSQAVHGSKYDYSCVQYKNTKTKVKIVCPDHGVFYQTPEKHISGHGCPKCAKNHKDTVDSFIQKAKAVHGDLYDYSYVEYVDTYTKVCIIDPEYGAFWQKPGAHLRGEGHPLRKPEKCYHTKKLKGSFHVSKPERIVYDLLLKKFGESNVFREYRSNQYPFSCDFWVKSFDLYIELNIYVTHGGHWFDPENVEDLKRLEYIKSKIRPGNLYQKMVYVWTESDVKKRKIAIQNKLNYCVFWDYDLTDFMEWYNNFDMC